MQLQIKYLEVPTEEQREYARKSVNATVESVKRDVQHIIEWGEKQPHLPDYRDEDVLAHCLLHCKHRLENTKRRLECYCNARALFPEVFRDRNPYEKCLEDQKNFAMFIPSRKLTPDGYRLAMLYLTDDSKAIIPPSENFLKINQMTTELSGKVDYNRGVIFIFDFANSTTAWLAFVSSNIKKFVFLTKSSAPICYKKIYVLNMVPGVNILLTIVKSLIKKKLADRFEILKNPTDLCNIFPKEIIPREYGGDELPLKELRDLWFEEIKNNYEYLKSLENMASDLSKLPKDYPTTELSGVAGSFKQISVD